MRHSTNTQSTAHALRDRVRAAEGDLAALENVERQITRHYNNGTLTANELTQLDAMVMARITKLSI